MIYALAADSRSVLVAVASQDRRVALWSPDLALPLVDFEGPSTAPARAVAFRRAPVDGPDGEYEVLAVGYEDGLLCIHPMGAPEQGTSHRSANGSIMSAGFAGDHVVYGTSDGVLGRMGAGQWSERGLAPGVSLIALQVSPDGGRVAVGGADGRVRIVSAATLETIGEFAAGGRMPFVWRVAWGPGDRLALATGDAYGVWGLDGRPIWRLQSDTLLTRCNGVDFSPDGARVVGTCGVERTIHDAATGERLQSTRTLHAKPIQTALFVDEATVMTGDEAGDIALWRIGGDCKRLTRSSGTPVAPERRGRVPGAPLPPPPGRR